MALGWAYLMLGDFHLAEDAAQDAFVAAYLNLHQLESPKSFPSWFKSIVRSECSRITRRKRVPMTWLDDGIGVTSGEPTPEDMVKNEDTLSRLYSAIRLLPENQRAVISLS